MFKNFLLYYKKLRDFFFLPSIFLNPVHWFMLYSVIETHFSNCFWTVMHFENSIIKHSDHFNIKFQVNSLKLRKYFYLFNVSLIVTRSGFHFSQRFIIFKDCLQITVGYYHLTFNSKQSLDDKILSSYLFCLYHDTGFPAISVKLSNKGTISSLLS